MERGSRRVVILGALGATGALVACSPQSVAQERGGTVRLSVATGGTGGVYYPYGGGLAKVISENVKGAQATAEVTSASVDNMKFVKDGKADIAFVLADTLDDSYKGAAAFKEFGKVPATALAVLYTNYTHVIALADKGINKIADLKGKVVSTGAAGSGTEVIAFRILEAAGLNPNSDVQKQSLNAQPSVDAMKDGKIDAFFWSGGLPTPAVTDLANTPRIQWKLLSNDDIIGAMQSKYGKELYYKANVPKSTYPSMAADVSVIGVANVLVVNEKMEESLAYDVTKVLFDKQAELGNIHPEAKNLKLETAVVGSPVPFHKGAIKYYREKKVWKG
ncbi:MAG TPA: TAXI family TRAP transporter solute-binding subunit [Chloroflexota bacterium]|nr:TAXI family TRAP transporter solute-binding subunit [Chloroflexota bacterium]